MSAGILRTTVLSMRWDLTAAQTEDLEAFERETAAQATRAALDRLAAVTVEEVAQVIADWTPHTGGVVTRIERDTAVAVLELMQARVAGP